MTTSATTDFNLDLAAIADEAWDRASGGVSELRAGYQMKSVRRSMNLLLADLANRGLNMWTIDSGTIDLIQGTSQYLLPDDTVDTMEVVLRLNDGSQTAQSDLYMSRISVSVYASLNAKLLQARPNQYLVSRTVPPTITVWPVPDQTSYYKLVYWRLRRVQDAGNGNRLHEYCESTFFRPLGMSRTHFHDDHAMIVKDRTSAYQPRRGRRYEISIPVFDVVGATSLFTTVEDLARWDQNFYDCQVGGKAVIEQMLTPGKLNNGDAIDYAYGLIQGKYKGLKFCEHSGSDAGYRAHMVRFPDQRVSVVVLCNLSTMNASGLARQVADIYLVDEIKRASADNEKQASGVKLSEQELASKAGFYWSPQTEECRQLSVEDGQLVTNLGRDYPLSPLDKDRFQMVGTTVELSFVPAAESGQQASMQVTAGGKPVLYAAIQPVVPTSAQLADCAGAYYSEELDVTYTLVLEDGRLLVRRKKFPDRTLRPTIADVFMSDQLGTIRFLRDADQKLTGFSLSLGRVRKLQFQKK